MRSRPIQVLVLALAAAGCGSSDAEAPLAKAPEGKLAKPGPQAPAGHLARAEVDRILVEQGPAWIFRRVLHQAAVRDDGKLTGWLLTGLPEEWRAIDLQPGDVVTRVNGRSLETPDDAWEIWKSVAKAREIKINLIRGQGARELVIPIDGEPNAAAAAALERPGPPRPPSGEPARGVVHIGDAPPDEVEHDSF